MPREIEMLARVAEAAATHVESARLGDDAGDDEERYQAGHDEDAAAIENARDQSEPAENFQPGEI